MDMKTMLEKMPKDVPVMGNVDPAGVMRMGTPEDVEKATLEVMEKCRGYNNFVLSSGCDIPPLTPWENIDAFFKTADKF